jgi:copper chaperone
MMSNTPRVFVGTTTFLIAGITSRAELQTVTAAINGFPGVRVVVADQVAGLLTVTAERPVNRADLTAAIIQAGYTVLA